MGNKKRAPTDGVRAQPGCARTRVVGTRLPDEYYTRMQLGFQPPRRLASLRAKRDTSRMKLFLRHAASDPAMIPSNRTRVSAARLVRRTVRGVCPALRTVPGSDLRAQRVCAAPSILEDRR
jgi:hypothetical protein